MGSSILFDKWNARHGTLTEKQQISALPSGFTGVSTSAEIRVHPSGRFLYVSNRGRDSIAVFSIDRTQAACRSYRMSLPGGKTPRNFDFDPTGRWLLVTNQDSDTAMVFRIDPQNGLLSPAGEPVHIQRAFSPRFLPLQQ